MTIIETPSNKVVFKQEPFGWCIARQNAKVLYMNIFQNRPCPHHPLRTKFYFEAFQRVEDDNFIKFDEDEL